MDIYENRGAHMEGKNISCCPCCGKPILHGFMVAGGIKSMLYWYPHKPSPWELGKHGFPFFRRGDPEKGLMLHRFTNDIHDLPAFHCPDCKLVMLDYDEAHAEYERW